jgi:FkbM family methyltransferase
VRDAHREEAVNEADLVRDTSDWHLPLKHEALYSAQFMKGGRTFIDIGAHVGTWALRLATVFERVICFEPDPRAYEALRKNVELAGLDNVEVVPKAVSDRTGKATINLYPNPCTNSMLTADQSGRHAEQDGAVPTEVETVSLDDYCAEHEVHDVDMVKIDAEGAELLIVPGAIDTFWANRPDFWIEMHGLFWARLRKLLSFERCDVIDGGRAGLSLAQHREAWPAFSDRNEFRVYPHGTAPTLADYEELRRLHGLQCVAPTSGFLSVEGV